MTAGGALILAQGDKHKTERDRIIHDLEDIAKSADAADCDDFIEEVADYILRRNPVADDEFTSPHVFVGSVR